MSGEGAEPRPGPHPVLRLARDYGRHHWRSYLLGFLALLATNWLAVRIPVEIGAAIDALRAGAPTGAHVVAIAAMGLLVMGVRTLSRVLFFNPGRDVEYELRRDIFDHLMRLRAEFYARHKRGDIVSRASNDITWARLSMGFALLAICNVSTALVMTGGQMVLLSPRLTLFIALPLVAGLAFLRVCIQVLLETQRRFQEEMGLLSDQVLGSLQGIATIQGFVAEEAFIQRFEVRNQRLVDLSNKLAALRGVAFPALILASGLAMTLLVGLGGHMALAGELSVGELAAFATLLATLAGPLRSLGWMLSVFQQSRAALERIFDLLDAPVDRPELPEPLPQPGPGHGVGFRIHGLDFAYPDDPERPALVDISVDIAPGEVVGIFGRTGSGKSTLIRLLARVYDPPPGTVEVRGVDGATADLRRLDLYEWRARLAVVPQRPFLFSDRIVDNIALEDPPDRERVERVVERAALAADLRALSDGLDTVVGERGLMLSGGQRQRVALARGLYRDADVIMLDDVLSAVDHETEARLVDTLTRLAHGDRGPTIFIVSHRLSALRHADRILVLHRGRLVDQGRHDELVSRPGVYRDTWRVQSQRATSPVSVAGGA
ncbi:MAG: ABC transporter ATP-binding protein [Deltaproteobacteria bacterium]|nr:MAG: ABC transporter ATP-binding protein [Deltaproteobacteria bacterium]